MEKEYRLRLKNGKNVSAERKSGECYQWKAKDSVQKVMLAASTTIVSVERKRNRPLLVQGRKHKMMEEILRKGSLPEAPVFVEGEIKKRTDITLKGESANPSIDYWHPPGCQNYKSESGCKFGAKCVCRHAEVDSQPDKKHKKSGVKGSVAFMKGVYTIALCVSRFSSEKTYSTESWKIGIKSRHQILQRHLSPN